MLLYHGRLDDLSSWSEKTQTIFHQWDKRSNVSENKYTGDYTLRAQLGSIILVTEVRKGKIRLLCNKPDHISSVKALIDHSIEHSGLTTDEFMRRLPLGMFVLTDNTLVKTTKNIGFNIDQSYVRRVQYYPGEIVHEGIFFILKDDNGNQIMKCEEGLMHTDYIPESIRNDVKIMGMSLRKLLPLRPFNTHFNLEYISDSVLCDLLLTSSDPLKVPKPQISEITKKRLGVINYDLRGMDMEYAEIVTRDDVDESKIDFIGDILALPEEELTFELDTMTKSEEFNFNDIWLDPTIDLNLLSTMTRQRLIYQPRKILERVMNLKYHIITRMVTNISQLNRNVIMAAKILLRNENITYSLVYTYDHQFTNTDAPSPHGCEIKLNPTFKQMLNIDIISDITLD